MRSPEIARIFVGYDGDVEPIAYHVCCESIIRHSTMPVQITPLALNTLRGLYSETHTDGSNAFIYSRFLVPWMCGWQGTALYLDGDMLVRGDVRELWGLARFDLGVQVVKHNYKTKHPVKYLGASNDDYPCKNHSSVILYNCGYAPHRKLLPEFVATAPGSYLHRFEWLNERAVGELPVEWNWLVSEYEKNDDAKLLHFTIGTPCFDGYDRQDGADEWFGMARRMLHPIKTAL